MAQPHRASLAFTTVFFSSDTYLRLLDELFGLELLQTCCEQDTDRNLHLTALPLSLQMKDTVTRWAGNESDHSLEAFSHSCAIVHPQAALLGPCSPTLHDPSGILSCHWVQSQKTAR